MMATKPLNPYQGLKLVFIGLGSATATLGDKTLESLPGIETPRSGRTNTIPGRDKTLESLPGIETSIPPPAIPQSQGATKPLNPYQGLKQYCNLLTGAKPVKRQNP